VTKDCWDKWRSDLDEIGGWDHALVSVPAEAVREMIVAGEALRARVAAIIGWLEREQPDVFRRGLWEAINEAEGKSASAARPRSAR
jgi:hypothetical protein